MGGRMDQRLVDLIRTARVPFGPYGQGISQEAIREAEQSMSVRLPPSYKWWLANYHSGQIRGDIIYGIDEGNLGLPDIVTLYQRNRLRPMFGDSRLMVAAGD